MDVEVVTNRAKTVALPPPKHIPMPEEIVLLARVRVEIAKGGEAVVVDIPIGVEAFA